jgi:hypothetical protein
MRYKAWQSKTRKEIRRIGLNHRSDQTDPSDPKMKKKNFDTNLEKNLENEEFANRFSEASEAWDLSVADALHARVRVILEPLPETTPTTAPPV